MRALRTFWSGKKLLQLFIFALLMGNISLYCVGMTAKRQVMANAMTQHYKIYAAFLQAVERARKPATDPQQNIDMAEADISATDDSTTANPSPYWSALKEMRRQFPYYRVAMLVQGGVDADADKKIFEMLRTRPRGWSITDENDGWARSFYTLSAHNTAALQVVSYVKDDLNAWEKTALMIGVYSFALLLIFGWLSMRGYEETSNTSATTLAPVENAQAATTESAPRNEQLKEEIRRRLTLIQDVLREMDTAFAGMHQAIENLEKHKTSPDDGVLKTLDEMVAQVRLLAVNGSIEAARSADTYRVFHVIMQEINQLATHSRELMKTLTGQRPEMSLNEIREKLGELQGIMRSGITMSNHDGATGGEPRSGGVKSSRRAG